MGIANEIELKFPLAAGHRLAGRLLKLGFISQGEVFESNVVFDTPDYALRAQGRLLRLRRDRRVLLTWKEPHQDSSLASCFKVRRESELELADFDTMRHILHRLDYTEERVYEKYREHFTRADGVAAELDRLPHIGRFLELEAEPAAIEEIAAELGLDTSRGIKANYIEIFQEWCERNGHDFTDIRFEDEREE